MTRRAYRGCGLFVLKPEDDARIAHRAEGIRGNSEGQIGRIVHCDPLMGDGAVTIERHKLKELAAGRCFLNVCRADCTAGPAGPRRPSDRCSGIRIRMERRIVNQVSTFSGEAEKLGPHRAAVAGSDPGRRTGLPGKWMR